MSDSGKIEYSIKYDADSPSLSADKPVAAFKICGVIYDVYDEDDIPNWFQRKMLKIFLGIRWKIYAD